MPNPMPLTRRHFAGLGAGLGLAVLGFRTGAAQTRLRLSAAAGVGPYAADGGPAPFLGYDGALPGPVLRIGLGEPASLAFRNGLAETTAIHWHGLRAPTQVKSAAPGEEIPLALTPRDAGTILYRPPLLGGEAQLRRGLAGLLIVDHAVKPAHDRELPLLLSEAPGEQALPAVLANGRPSLGLTVRPGERLWLRIANGTPHRILRFAIPDQALTLVALDSQPCEPFRLEGGRIVLGPGQRAEVLWDVSPTGAAIPVQVARFGGGGIAEEITVEPQPLRETLLPPPGPLPANPVPQAMDFRRATRWDWTIGGTAEAPSLAGRAEPGPPAAAQVRLRPGAVAMVAIRNDAPVIHAVHLQGHAARLLDGLDDGWKPYFLDTVLVAPGMTSRVAFTADQPGRFLVTSQPINAEAGPVAIALDVA